VRVFALSSVAAAVAVTPLSAEDRKGVCETIRAWALTIPAWFLRKGRPGARHHGAAHVLEL